MLQNYAADATSTAPAPLCATKEQLVALNCQDIINPTGTVNAQVREYWYPIHSNVYMYNVYIINNFLSDPIEWSFKALDEHIVEVTI